jgi:hypothetical protein
MQIAGLEAPYEGYGWLVEAMDEAGVPYLAPPSKDERDRLRECSLEHLRYYRHLWALYEEYERLEGIVREMRRNFISQLSERLRM